MTDHGWPDHHDDGDPAFHDEPLHFDDPHQDLDQHQPPDDDWYAEHHDSAAPDDVHEVHDDPDLPYEHHPDDLADTHPDTTGTTGPEMIDTESVFPPAVDVGPLPEPVDGFPWIDTGSLGLVDAAAVHADAGTEPVDPHELAEYAGTDLPPGVDPWAALADSDDPATAALARWWSENQQ